MTAVVRTLAGPRMGLGWCVNFSPAELGVCARAAWLHSGAGRLQEWSQLRFCPPDARPSCSQSSRGRNGPCLAPWGPPLTNRAVRAASPRTDFKGERSSSASGSGQASLPQPRPCSSSRCGGGVSGMAALVRQDPEEPGVGASSGLTPSSPPQPQQPQSTGSGRGSDTPPPDELAEIWFPLKNGSVSVLKTRGRNSKAREEAKDADLQRPHPV